MLTKLLIANIIENVDSKSDNFLLKYNTKTIKSKMERLLIIRNKVRLKRRVIPKIKNYFGVIKRYPDDVFYTHFRMSRSTFAKLQNSLKPFWTRTLRGRLGISLEKCLYISLWKLCNSDVTFRELSDRFNVGRGTTHKIFYKTIYLICRLKNQITWPSVLQQQTIMENFQNSRYNPFPFVIGCVDGTHFCIPTPTKDARSYYNRKGNYTIIMQAIVDSKFRFLDVFIGCPGSCHDAHVWKVSPIFKSIILNRVELAENALILGGSAYPLSKFLMTPYRDNGHLSPEEKQFNYYLSSTRVFVEQAYGILKTKFKILKYLNLGSIEKASKAIFACTILHNFIINNENQPYNLIENLNENNTIESYSSSSVHVEEDNNDGLTMRRNLTLLFCS